MRLQNFDHLLLVKFSKFPIFQAGITRLFAKIFKPFFDENNQLFMDFQPCFRHMPDFPGNGLEIRRYQVGFIDKNIYHCYIFRNVCPRGSAIKYVITHGRGDNSIISIYKVIIKFRQTRLLNYLYRTMNDSFGPPGGDGQIVYSSFTKWDSWKILGRFKYRFKCITVK